MKRIEFIAPVEAMRGNLSGTQKSLEYPSNDNAAYDAPIGRQYARNYKPCFIGAKRASDGLKYFGVRTKSAFGMSLKSKKAMAVLGGTGAIVGAILRDKTSAIFETAYAAYEKYMERQTQKASFRKWLSVYIIRALKAKAAIIGVGNTLLPGQGFTFNNPWVTGGSATLNVTLSNEILVKFWGELANAPIEFTVGGLKGVAHSGQTFDAVMNVGNINVLGLTADGNGYVKMGSHFLWDNDNYVDVQTTVAAKAYETTDVYPEP